MTTNRMETGPLKPDGDWTGIFIRGDDALSYAGRLRRVFDALDASARAGVDEARAVAADAIKMRELAELLASCREVRN